MTATDLHKCNTEKAPDNWKLIPNIAQAKPKQNNCEISLQRITNTNLCLWETGKGGNWFPASPIFIVEIYDTQ